VSAKLQTGLDLPARPSVSLGGFPFVAHLVTGSFPTVSLASRDVIVDGVPIERIDMTFHDVEVRAGQLLSKEGGTITAGSGEGTAVVTGPGATEALRSQGVPVTVRFAGGTARLSAAQLSSEIEARVQVEDGRLVLSPLDEALGVTFSIELPQVVKGVRFTSAHVAGKNVELSFVVAKRSIRV
jgi:DUF2993 family protein